MSVLKKTVLLCVLAAAVVVGQGQGAKVFPPTDRAESRDSQEARRVERAPRRARVEEDRSRSSSPTCTSTRRRPSTSCASRTSSSGRTTRPRRLPRSTPASGAAIELENGTSSWTRKTGNVVRGFVSRIDGSLQPYGLTIPASYDGKRPMRLDIWLHGTQQQMNEVRFLQQQAGPHRDIADPRRRLHHGRAVRADEPLVQVLCGDRRLRGDRGGAQALQHRSRAHRHPRPLDGRASGLGTARDSEPHVLRRLRSERRLFRNEGIRRQSPSEGGPDAVSGSGAALRRRRRLRAECVQRSVRQLRRREGCAVERVDPVPRGGRAGRIQADEGIALQVDDERFARAVPDRPRHRACVAQGEQGGVGGVPPKSHRRDRRQSRRTTCGSSPTRRDTTTRTG